LEERARVSDRPGQASKAPPSEAVLLRRSQTRLIAAAAMWSVWANTTQGAVHRLFVMCLGGTSAVYMGLLETVVQGGVLGQILGLRLLPRFGKTGLLTLGRLLGIIPILGLIVLAAVGGSGPFPVALAIASYAAMSFIYAIGSTSWWPLMQDNTSPGQMGEFFARTRTRLRVVDVLLPIAVGAYLGRDPASWKFILPFLLAVAALLTSAKLVQKVRHRPPEEPDAPLGLRLRLAARSTSILPCLLFIFLNSFMLGLTLPQWQFMLKEHRHMPDSFVVWTTALSAIGHLAGLRLWAWMVDTHGFRSVVMLSVMGSAVLGLGWLALPGAGSILTIAGFKLSAVMTWGVVFYLFWGFIEGGILMGRTTSMLYSVPSVYQADGLTLAMLALSGGASLGGIAGGFFLDLVTKFFRPRGWLDPKVLYLAGAQLLVLLALIPARRLTGLAKQTPARQIPAILWRRMTGKSEPD
jgi:hypothetical protein